MATGRVAVRDSLTDEAEGAPVADENDLPNPTDDHALFGRGARLRTEVLGADHVARNGGIDYEAATALQRLGAPRPGLAGGAA